jgi:signal transduction histidine kinase
MKKVLFVVSILVSTSLYSQDSIPKKINAVWVEPEVVFESDKKEEVVEEPEPVSDIESIKSDLQFLEQLPKSYDEVPKEDLKNVLKGIDDKINRLIQERDSLLNCKVVNQQLVDTKNGTIKTLEKEKDIIGLTIESDDLKDENGNLVGQNDELTTEKNQLKRYLYISLGVLVALALIIAVVLQRKKIQVQDVEIEKQLDDINKKNTYLEHAAKIIRHDMHSGINTYIPRGLTSLEKRVTPDELKNLKIDTSIKMIKDGLAHTQRVYKSVYEFTNLVKQHVVLDKKLVDIKDILTNYISNTSYSSQVDIKDLIKLEVNEILFCNAVDNLIKNGLKYNDSNDKLVNIYIEEDYLVVKDNGRGLTQKQFEKVIKPKKDENKESEMALGLSISNVIFKEHGFEMFCDKKEIGTEIKIKIK